MNQNSFTRRDAITGLGGIALSALAAERAMASSSSPLAPKQANFAPRAKNVIFLMMRGAPSYVDTFDYKPQLTKDSGKEGKYGSKPLVGSRGISNNTAKAGCGSPICSPTWQNMLMIFAC